jgi:hypothetical protein
MVPLPEVRGRPSGFSRGTSSEYKVPEETLARPHAFLQNSGCIIKTPPSKPVCSHLILIFFFLLKKFVDKFSSDS